MAAATVDGGSRGGGRAGGSQGLGCSRRGRGRLEPTRGDALWRGDEVALTAGATAGEAVARGRRRLGLRLLGCSSVGGADARKRSLAWLPLEVAFLEELGDVVITKALGFCKCVNVNSKKGIFIIAP
ncbi:hypothetical protein VPH35_002408 [Triticum aestivum]